MGLILGFKYKLINLLLQLNILIGQKLVYMKNEYDVGEYIKKPSTFDLRSIPTRFKALMIYDQDVIDKRKAICQECDYKIGTNCSVCGCIIAAKVRVNFSCPKGKWKKIINYNKPNVAPITS